MIQLQTPTLDLVPSYMDFMNEMNAHGEKIWDGTTPYSTESHADFIQRLHLEATSPMPDRVAESTYWATQNNQVIGRISLRHKLNKNLQEFGGNIGYEVRPSFRRKGVATAMLKLLLQTPKAKQIKNLLLTCSPDNLASIRTIELNGGTFERTAFVEKWNRQTSYYWINL